ncbi:nischarin-like [Leopardus geoffroyi]|uniref:nischarin-like n=1 Tax=Leopardus geoffroyi TaxID=46844 RepID=UPI001E264DBD|nr:nischarin-like [Leopardus geoffroyi]
MFSCCVPVSRGCWLRGARGCDAPRPGRQWVRSCTGRLRSLARREPKKSTDEIGRRLSESCPTEVCVCPVAQEGHPGPGERVAARRSPEAGPGDGLGGPPSPPGPLHRVLAQRSWDQDPEPPEPEPEPEESGAGAEAGAALEPNPTASGTSAALEAGVASGATPAGARQPAGDLGPVRGQRAPGQSQLGPASAPNTVPATALLPAPAPAPATALAPTWMPATDRGPEGLHGVFILFLVVPIPDPDTLPQCLFLFSLILSLLFFLAVTLFLHCWFIIHINLQ